MLSVAVCASSSSYGPRYSGLSFPCRNSMAATVNLRATGNDSRSQVCTFLICGPLQNVSQLSTAWSGHSYQLLQGHGFKTIMSSLSKARPGKPDTSKMVSHQSPLNWSPNLNPFRVPKTDFFPTGSWCSRLRQGWACSQGMGLRLWQSLVLLSTPMILRCLGSEQWVECPQGILLIWCKALRFTFSPFPVFPLNTPLSPCLSFNWKINKYISILWG